MTPGELALPLTYSGPSESTLAARIRKDFWTDALDAERNVATTMVKLS
jgi:hypothetical protein